MSKVNLLIKNSTKGFNTKSETGSIDITVDANNMIVIVIESLDTELVIKLKNTEYLRVIAHELMGAYYKISEAKPFNLN